MLAIASTEWAFLSIRLLFLFVILVGCTKKPAEEITVPHYGRVSNGIATSDFGPGQILNFRVLKIENIKNTEVFAQKTAECAALIRLGRNDIFSYANDIAKECLVDQRDLTEINSTYNKMRAESFVTSEKGMKLHVIVSGLYETEIFRLEEENGSRKLEVKTDSDDIEVCFASSKTGSKYKSRCKGLDNYRQQTEDLFFFQGSKKLSAVNRVLESYLLKETTIEHAAQKLSELNFADHNKILSWLETDGRKCTNRIFKVINIFAKTSLKEEFKIVGAINVCALPSNYIAGPDRDRKNYEPFRLEMYDHLNKMRKQISQGKKLLGL